MYQFNFQPVFENLDLLLYGAWLTVRLSFLAMILGLVASLLGAIAKTSAIRPLRWLVDVYVEVIRNTPFLIQIFFIFYVRFSESERRRETALAFMYPTCIIGASLALLLPSIFTSSEELAAVVPFSLISTASED